MSTSENRQDQNDKQQQVVESCRKVLEGARVSFLATSQDSVELDQQKQELEKKKYEKN